MKTRSFAALLLVTAVASVALLPPLRDSLSLMVLASVSDGTRTTQPLLSTPLEQEGVVYLPFVRLDLDSQMDWASSLIEAESGGSVTLDEVSLSIPPGALMEDTMVSIGQPKDAPDMLGQGIGYIQLEPSGLDFSTPASLSIRYEEASGLAEEFLNAYTYSTDGGLWDRLPIISHDTGNNKITFEVKHFSGVTTIFERPIDLVLGLPGKFLTKGDLLYHMSYNLIKKETYWFPGHAAIYLGSDNGQAGPEDNDGKTFIESVPKGKWVVPCPSPGGVQLSEELAEFMADTKNFYMGARTVPDLTPAERTAIATFALSKQDKGYFPIGQGNWTDWCYSCVGLTEAAHDAARRGGIIPRALEESAIVPLEQYVRTQPVGEITVKAGDVVAFPAWRVYWSESEDTYLQDYQVTISTCPSRAICDDGYVYWETKDSDVGVHVLGFSASATTSKGQYSAFQNLAIQVVGTGNNSPYTPSGESPSDGATGQSVNVDLSWSGGDPDADSVTYDVYFEAGDATPDSLACDDVSSTFCDPGTLSYDTHYYWKVVARDEHGATETGPVWDFWTVAAPCTDPPDKPRNRTPSDGATGISVEASLDWSGGHPCLGETVTYDVYLEGGDSTPDDLVCNDVTSSTCVPGTLGHDTHYYWKVVANGANGPTTGPVWDFTTGGSVPGYPLTEDFDSSAGFTSTDPDVYIDGGKARWSIRLTEGQQYVYRSIPPSPVMSA